MEDETELWLVLKPPHTPEESKAIIKAIKNCFERGLAENIQARKRLGKKPRAKKQLDS